MLPDCLYRPTVLNVLFRQALWFALVSIVVFSRNDYYIELLHTYIHELCHLIVGILTGDKPFEISVSENCSGYVRSEWGIGALLSLPAGYLGTAACGCFLFRVSSDDARSRRWLLITILITLGLVGFSAETIVVLFYLLSMGFILALVFALGMDGLTCTTVRFLGASLIVETANDFRIMFRIPSHRRHAQVWEVVRELPPEGFFKSDAITMAYIFRTTEAFWIGTWCYLSFALVVIAVAYAARDDLKRMRLENGEAV